MVLAETGHRVGNPEIVPNGFAGNNLVQHQTRSLMWYAATGKTLAMLQGHTAAVNRAVFSPDGSPILPAS